MKLLRTGSFFTRLRTLPFRELLSSTTPPCLKSGLSSFSSSFSASSTSGSAVDAATGAGAASTAAAGSAGGGICFAALLPSN